jgi:hypothetical protein
VTARRRGDVPKGPAYEHYRVRVRCTDAHHPGRTVYAGTYVGSRRPGEPGGWSRLGVSGPTSEERDDFHDNLLCKLCPKGGAKVSARLRPTLGAAFDALADARQLRDGGTASVELRTLAAIVSRQQASRSA